MSDRRVVSTRTFLQIAKPIVSLESSHNDNNDDVLKKYLVIIARAGGMVMRSWVLRAR